ncbi:tyrosine-protein phosphatase non-receptor type 2-like isoform X2 [Watersipora subatra]|uniref:tyrosine-protein phosphatase non-receptor type 2-like isoform X2 n=1 Tax=Watersipora subatra TaxID=2589382 RepID=UPI00355C37D1
MTMASMIEEEYENFTREGQWKHVFDRIQNEAAVLYNFSSKQARSAENRDRNRYRDVSPYDDYRVKLEGCENNYINASRVEAPDAGRTYILTQGPLGNTSGHFWLMVWQQNSRGVLMLNRVVEDGRLKCHPYFPIGCEYGGDETMSFPDVGIQVEHIKTDDHGYFLVRTLRLINLETRDAKLVLQFHYIDWPDFGIPKNSESFLSFLDAVRQSGVISSSRSEVAEVGPPVIHCSAGIGRSGTFCLVDSALVQVERRKSLLTMDLRSMLLDLRRYRCGLIQRPEQLKFSYMAILDGAHALLASPSPSPQPDHISDTEEELVESSSDLSDPDTQEMTSILNTAKDNGPAPPVRTSSLTVDEKGASNGQPPPKPQRTQPAPFPSEPQTKTNIPDPPTRTTSLHKSASVDEHPPPVPPRPPSTFDRQRSAPGAVPTSSEADNSGNVSGEDVEGLDPANRSPIKRKREEMREERKRKLKEKVEEMRAKQLATGNSDPNFFPHWGLMVGAGISILVAAGILYYQSPFSS